MRPPRGRRPRLLPQDDRDPDAVVCRLCGQGYRAITSGHLRRIHRFRGAHPIEDYKRRFGIQVTACRAVRRVLRQTMEDYWKRKGRRWPRKRILTELRRRARKGLPLAPSQLDMALLQGIRRHFASFEQAMQRAGLDPSAHRLIRRWNLQRLTEEVRRMAGDGRILASQRMKREESEVYGAAVRLTGSWGAALKMAGLDPVVHRERRGWEIDRAKEYVRSAHAEGRPIWSTLVPQGLPQRVRRETGMRWADFVESLGIPYPGEKHRLDWSKAAVVAAIRDRRRRGLPLNEKAVRTGGVPGLATQGRVRFGSWDAALRAAKINPNSVRLHRNWTRGQLVHAIRARCAAGRPMNRAAVLIDEPRLLRGTRVIFPDSWSRALAAAGLDPALARSSHVPRSDCPRRR